MHKAEAMDKTCIILNTAAFDPELSPEDRETIEAFWTPRVVEAAREGLDADGVESEEVEVRWVHIVGECRFIIEPGPWSGLHWTRVLVDDRVQDWWQAIGLPDGGEE